MDLIQQRNTARLQYSQRLLSSGKLLEEEILAFADEVMPAFRER